MDRLRPESKESNQIKVEVYLKSSSAYLGNMFSEGCNKVIVVKVNNSAVSYNLLIGINPLNALVVVSWKTHIQ